MDLTEEESLEKCAEMWDLMAEHGYLHKEDAIAMMGLSASEVRACCFCCEYSFNNRNESGTNYCDGDCIMASVWNVGVCDGPGSPYYEWRDSFKNEEDRKKYAKIIADGARECLKKLKKVK